MTEKKAETERHRGKTSNRKTASPSVYAGCQPTRAVSLHPKKKEAKKKLIYTIGRRKTAVARAVTTDGNGTIRINGKDLNAMEPEVAKLSIMEPLILAGDSAKKINVEVNVSSGGVFGQTDAARQAIAKALVEKDKSLREIFLKYDRSLLVSDIRRNETHKPGPSKPRRHKQRSKR